MLVVRSLRSLLPAGLLALAAVGLLACATAEPGAVDGGDDDVPDALPAADADTPTSDGAADGAPDVDGMIDATPCVPTGAEACNGVDDDCDGTTDEGFSGVGLDCDVGVGGCERNGTTVCSADGATVVCSVMPGAPGTELCGTAVDEDCDGLTDEGFAVGTPCTVGVGACAASGMTMCAPDGLSTQCSATPGVAGTELCGNATDDDCDGTTDEGFPSLGMGCSVGVGACTRTGNFVCDAGGMGVTCNVVAGMPATETCNGIDDDCDSMTDEGLGLGAMCDGSDADLCNEGSIICNAVGGTTCSDTSGDNLELCNGLDDDCNGATTDGGGDPMLGTGCDGSDGDLCLEGARFCSGGALQCSDATGTTSESCNNADDDCDGAIDETWPGKGSGCSVGVGACAASGTYQCLADGTNIACSATAGTPGAEYCGDGVDSDCNGGVDPSCPTGDLASSPVDITAGGTFTADVTYAHDDASGCGATGGRDVFFQFSLATPQVVYFDTFGSDFDTVLRLRAGSCSAADTSCIDDTCSTLQSQLATSLSPGTYCVVVDQFSSSTTAGAVTLHYTPGGRTGTAITAGSGSYTGNTCGLSDSSTPSCVFATGAADVGYYFTMCPADTRTVNANSCTGTAWDSAIHLRAGTAEVACNDDSCGLQSTLPATAISGANLYWLIMDGYSTNCGAYTLTVSM